MPTHTETRVLPYTAQQMYDLVSDVESYPQFLPWNSAARIRSRTPRPDGSEVIDLTVELLDDGEVSTYLHEVVAPGDELEVRGPIGAFFAWDGTSPALLVAGGVRVCDAVLHRGGDDREAGTVERARHR